MIRQEIIADLKQVAKYLAEYPSVRGSEAANWAQLLAAVSTIVKELEEYNKNLAEAEQELANDFMEATE